MWSATSQTNPRGTMSVAVPEYSYDVRFPCFVPMHGESPAFPTSTSWHFLISLVPTKSDAQRTVPPSVDAAQSESLEHVPPGAVVPLADLKTFAQLGVVESFSAP